MTDQIAKWYRLLAPRPVVLVGTRDGSRVPNVAPFSFVMPVSSRPALLAFASAPQHATLANIRSGRDFTVNVPGPDMLAALWCCGKKRADAQNKFERAGLHEQAVPGLHAPGVRGALVIFGCELVTETVCGDHVLVIGEIRAIVCDRNEGEKSYDCCADRPLMHVGGNIFTVPGGQIRAD